MAGGHPTGAVMLAILINELLLSLLQVCNYDKQTIKKKSVWLFEDSDTRFI